MFAWSMTWERIGAERQCICIQSTLTMRFDTAVPAMAMATRMVVMVKVKARHDDCESNNNNNDPDAGFCDDDVRTW